MKKSILYPFVFLLISGLFVSCGDDDDAMDEDKDPGNEEVTLGDNEVVFADDQIVCTPFTSNPSISAQGILNVIMNPCQNSGSALNGYFKYNSRPAAGTYTVIGTVGQVPESINGISPTEFGMVFYGHTAETLYSTGGTVELTVNAADATKLDMSWTDVTMEGQSGASIKFSGKFVGL